MEEERPIMRLYTLQDAAKEFPEYGDAQRFCLEYEGIIVGGDPWERAATIRRAFLHGQHQFFTRREAATILAALRHWQRTGSPVEYTYHFADDRPLSSDEIDALCERLNLE